MSITVNIQEAKTNLSKLITASLSGEEVIIANRNVAVIRLVPYVQPNKRELGFVGGEESWDDSFFDQLPGEELEMWGL
jgi:prevent-host-death family protein